LDQPQKKITVIYGLGHLPELEKLFIDELGLSLVDEEWLTAFSFISSDSDE
jgi:hypothetical protein